MDPNDAWNLVVPLYLLVCLNGIRYYAKLRISYEASKAVHSHVF